MSLSYQKLKPIEVRDPRIIVDNVRDYAILKGGSDVTPKLYSTTNVSQNSISFSTPPPSPNMIVDRKVFLTICARLSFTGTPAVGRKLLNVGQDAPRAFPLSSALDTLNCQINGTSVSVDMADVIQPLMRFNTDAKLKTLDYSMTPTAMDQSQEYSSLSSVATVRNPLGVYWEASQEAVTGRGAANFVIVDNPTGAGVPVTALVDVRFTEPIFMLAPFIWGKHQSGGLYNVNTLDWTFNWLSQAANRMWSHDPSAGGVDFAVGGTSVAFAGQTNGPTTPGYTQTPSLLITWITPPETAMLGPNLSISYPFFRIDRFPTDMTGITAGSSTTISSNNIQLTSIPRRLYIFARERNSDLYASASKTDTFLAISNINIQFNNRSGILSTATQEQLYQMSVKNHCNMSWEEWAGYPMYRGTSFADPQYGTVGSVICAEFGTDIANQTPIEAPGKQGTYQLQVNAAVKNISASTKNVSLYVVPVYEGVFTIPSAGTSAVQIGVITSNDILDAGKSGYYNYHDIQAVNGGDFLSGIKDFFSKANQFLKDNKVISTILDAFPVTKPFAGPVRNIGYGEDGGEGEGVLVGGLHVGGMNVGGAKMSRSQLRRRLMQ